jgi:hypothetical protein
MITGGCPASVTDTLLNSDLQLGLYLPSSAGVSLNSVMI